MAIPITYNLRNLAVRRVTTIMTALGAAVAVVVLISVLALVDGLRTSFAATGEPHDLLVLRKGATSELISVVTRQNYQDIRARPGIEHGADGQPLASLEFVEVINVADSERGRDMNFNLRGVMPAGFLLRPSFRIIQGRKFEPGRREVIVGKSIADRFRSAHPGGILTFGHGDWRIVGIFEVGRTVFNGEIWGDLNQVSSDYDRAQNLSSLLLRAQPEHAVALSRVLEQDRRFTLKVIPERQYYADQTSSAVPVQFMGTLVAIITAVGSAFAAMNTMYAAVARRSPEIGTLRALGFTRQDVLLCFVAESLVLALLGGAVGCLLSLPLNYISTDIGSYNTFSTMTFNFHVSLRVMLWGMMFAIVIGTCGGLLPAARAARMDIVSALKRR
jgi:putative ABC transport system permease protein